MSWGLKLIFNIQHVLKFVAFSDFLCRDFPYNLIAKILVSLTMKDTSAGLKFLLGPEGLERWALKKATWPLYLLAPHSSLYNLLQFLVQSPFSQEPASHNAKDSLAEMERLYLQFSFNMLPSDMRGTDEQVLASASCQFSAVPALRNKLEQSLLCVADNLLNCYSPDVSGSQSTCAHCRLSDKWVLVIIPVSLPAVSGHASRVSGALFQSADRCSSRLCLHWFSDWGGGMPFAALY